MTLELDPVDTPYRCGAEPPVFPRVTATGDQADLRADRHGVVRVNVACSKAACSGVVRLFRGQDAHSPRIARAEYGPLSPGERQRVAIKLSRAKLHELRKRRRWDVSATVTAAGTARRVDRTWTLLAPKRR